MQITFRARKMKFIIYRYNFKFPLAFMIKYGLLNAVSLFSKFILL